MAMKAVIDKLEDVPEPFREHYVAGTDGKFSLGVDGHDQLAPFKALKDENAKRRIAERTTSEKLAPYLTAFGDKKVDDILSVLDRVPELEAAAAGKIDEKKINEMVETRITSKTAPLQRQVEKLTQDLTARDTKIAEFEAKERTRTINDAVREAVAKSSGFQGAALEDAMMFAERHFTIDDAGKVVTKDNVGVTPGVAADVWLTEMQQKKPHWWGETKGGGASGGKGGTGGSANPWARETWNMTEQGKIVVANRTRADQLAKAAGTTVGGPMPLPRK